MTFLDINNQDEVARILTRVPADLIHRLVWTRGCTDEWARTAWTTFVRHPETAKFILSHGWTLSEYVTLCKNDSQDESSEVTHMRWVFANYAT